MIICGILRMIPSGRATRRSRSRGVWFVSSRTGRVAIALEKVWWQRYGTEGSALPQMRMSLVEAMELLGVPADYTKADVMRAFRRAALRAHPDHGGTAEMFRTLVDARNRLLAALGTSAPPPKTPSYAPRGTISRYGSIRSSRARLSGGGVPRLA